MTRRRTVALAALVFVVALARYAPVITDPWDNTQGSVVAVCYTSAIVRSFLQAGFGTLRGEPHVFVEPIPEPVGFEYPHHPPLSFWLQFAVVRALGWSEPSFRITPIVLSAVATVALFLLVARHYGATLGLVAAGIALAIPMGFLFGWLAGYEPGVFACMMLAFLAHDALRARPVRLWSLTLVPCFAAPLFDWQGCFVGIGLLVSELLLPRGERRSRRVIFGVGPVMLLAVASVVALQAWWAGVSFAERIGDLAGVAGVASAGRMTLTSWAERQWHYWTTLMTWPVTALAAVGLLVSLFVARRDAVARFAIAAFVTAAANVIVFRARSLDHDFWWFTGIAAAAAAPVVVLRRVPRRSTFVGATCALACVAVVLHGSIESVRQYRVHRTTINRDVGAELSTLAGPGDIILFPVPLHCAQFYLRAAIYMPVLDAFPLELIRRFHGHEHLAARRIVFVTSRAWGSFPAIDAALPRLGRVEHLDRAALTALMPAVATIASDLTIAHIGE